jgi:uncharacterized damage-inducible protein DinB
MSTAAQNTSSTPQTAPAEPSLIAEQLHRAYRGPAWHGPSLKAILLDVSEERAREQPPSGAHSIREIVLHIAAWMRIARERLTAAEIRQVSDEEDWPESNESWTAVLQALDQEERALEEAIRQFPAARLHERAPAAEPQTFYVLLHGIVQHTLYHAGQIILLNK